MRMSGIDGAILRLICPYVFTSDFRRYGFRRDPCFQELERALLVIVKKNLP